MKILTKEEEQAHYNETLKGGAAGGIAGLAVGALGVYGASIRYPAFRQLTIPLRAFLVTSSGTFASIVSADAWSRSFERNRHPEQNYQDEQQTLQQQINAQRTTKERATAFMSDNRYAIVFGSWVASISAALGIVGRNPYLTGQQKLVQARVYAQGLTLAVVIVSLAFETNDSSKGKGRWETVKILDPNDPTHKNVIEKKIHHESYAGEDQWRDMIEAEEARLKERDEAIKKREQEDKKKGKHNPKHHHKDQLHGEKPDEAKNEKLNAP
ncbi:Replication factor C, subunit RFC4 [Vermiconidia calcicola]|uniref:Replication factor C, subunit RFC4 n=1 Tax=Vermiconidia calcicola TaxID=1690605 RepID=A0ACC3N475_9PEZI|nr:Replication factor C, subunit RFC4 [Vermiconidia calcicola]